MDSEKYKKEMNNEATEDEAVIHQAEMAGVTVSEDMGDVLLDIAGVRTRLSPRSARQLASWLKQAALAARGHR
jgi:hypothetical protein